MYFAMSDFIDLSELGEWNTKEEKNESNSQFLSLVTEFKALKKSVEGSINKDNSGHNEGKKTQQGKFVFPFGGSITKMVVRQ